MDGKASGKGMYRAALARRAGCNIETVRYYETSGLMPEPPRTPAGYRVYDESHEARLRFVLRARGLGFSLEAVRGLLDLVDGGQQTCAHVKQRTERHLAEVREKIADLQRIEAALAQLSARCSGERVPECPVLDALAS